MGIYISDTVYIYIALNQAINLFVITEEVNNDCYSTWGFLGHAIGTEFHEWLTLDIIISNEMYILPEWGSTLCFSGYHIMMLELYFICFKADYSSWGISKSASKRFRWTMKISIF